MTFYRAIEHISSSEGMAISFFIIMLGMAFIFPSLLKDKNKGLSTMRIVVFMMVNVICILLLKIGWANGITSLKQIGLDQYWMGVIAFVFGAKATQSYFESKLAVLDEIPKVGMAGITFTNGDIAKLAVTQNEQFLKVKFPNILSVSDAVNDLNSPDSHVITLYLNNNITVGIPNALQVKMPDGTVETIATEIIKDVGAGGIQINQKDEIRRGNSHGSICCIVETEDGTKKAVTAGHVFTSGSSKNYGGELDTIDQASFQINRAANGNWFFQIIDFKNDVALASIDNWVQDSNYISFKGKGHYEITDNDIKKTIVNVISNVSNPQKRTAVILDYNTAWDVRYSDQKISKNNIIVIGNNADRAKSASVSQSGDSGGLVYEPKSGNLVGLILGGNSLYTWVLPLKEIFETFNYKLI